MKTKNKNLSALPLMYSVGIIAICGIIYELSIGAIGSYLLGNSVKQYSITIGLFMSAMGVGSYLTRFVKKYLFDFFVFIELTIGFIGGASAIILFWAYGNTSSYHLYMYSVIILIGILVGLEIPILTRIQESREHNLRITISNVLSFDYIGALVGSLAFPLILLPHLGEIRTSFLVGLINIFVAIFIYTYYKELVFFKKRVFSLSMIILVITILGFIFGDSLGNRIEDGLYRDKIIYKKQSKYQKLVLTKHRDDLRLYLDGNIQFSSLDEYRYHEALVHPAMSLAKKREEILILGGGDGMAAREILKYPEVKSITIVDLDEAVTDLCKNNNLIKKINKNSLIDKKVRIVNEDAFGFLENTNKGYDLIIVDLPDPNNEALSKLYSTVFYRLIYRALNRGGITTIQSTSPYFANKAYWCIRKTVAHEFKNSSGYHANVPSFGQWGFTIASKGFIDFKNIKLRKDLKFLTDDLMKSMFIFPKDVVLSYDKIKINRLTSPRLIDYYAQAWNQYN